MTVKTLLHDKKLSPFSFSTLPLCSGILLLGASLGAAPAAMAESYFSIEGSSVLLVSEPHDGHTAGGMRFRLGTQVSEAFDIEGHFGFSFEDDTESYDELGIGYMGAYLKGYMPIGQRSALFGLAGWSTISISQEVGQGEFSEDRTGFSWGFGMETQLTENLDLTADYMSYLRDEGLFEEVSAFNIGLKLYF